MVFAVLLVVLAGAAAFVWYRVLPSMTARDYALAQQQYRGGEYRNAIQTLEKIYKWNPWDARVNALLGWSHWRAGDQKRA